MKKQLLFLCLSALLTFGAYAQDLGVKSFTPNDKSTIKAGATVGGLVNLEVLSALPANTSFSMSYSIDGKTPVVIAPQIGFQQAVQAGANINPVPFSLKVPNKIGDTIKVRLYVNLGSDINRSNDTITHEYYLVESVPNDLAVSIISPDANSDQKTWTTVPFTIKIKNVGNTTLTKGTPIVLRLVVNNQAGNAQAITYNEADLAPGDSGSVSLNINLPRRAAIGTTNICIAYLWAVRNGNTVTSIEGSVGDNLGCVSLNVIANSIDETKIALNAINFNNGQLNVDLENKGNIDQFRFDILSITGQQITSSSANGGAQYLNHNVSLNGLTNGMYLVNIYADGEYIGSEKFMVR